ncbi:MAG: hypothetical protein LH610_11675 [Sphingomonas bacterium]|nr:hypothetical protein [Sphingomonas bacterium]
MTSPFQTSKKSVDLAAPGRGSRIRRDPPPPPPKEVSAADVKEQEARTILIGITAVALSLFVILIGLSSAAGWSPGQYTIHIKDSG